jgi:hypothetical protein
LSLGAEPVGVGIRDAFTHKQVIVADSVKTNIYEHFIECLQFIEGSRGIGQNGAVLVHCHEGISRSATVVIAYLMWKYSMPMDDAYALVSRARPLIRPNIGFQEQLSVFQWRLASARPTIGFERLTNVVELLQQQQQQQLQQQQEQHLQQQPLAGLVAPQPMLIELPVPEQQEAR